MMNLIRLYLRLAWRYLKYYWRAKTRYGLHSPFVYSLAEAIVEDSRTFYAFPEIERLRWSLLRDDSPISVTDYGAGSRMGGGPRRTVRSLARHSAISAATGRLLFRLVQFTKPRTMLELGSSLGISAAYQAAAAPKARFLTIEGCPETASLAARHFQRLKLENVRLATGTFQDRLPEALENLKVLDYLYIDGDHRRSSILAYFNQCLAYTHPGSVIAVADIHWSGDMEKAWDDMRRHPRVSLSVDLFHIGLLFFREEQLVKEHYTIIRSRYKPWRMGFFA